MLASLNLGLGNPADREERPRRFGSSKRTSLRNRLDAYGKRGTWKNEGKAISGVVGYQIVAKTRLKRANAYLA